MKICRICDWVHSADDVIAVGRFSSAQKFRARYDGSPIRDTRDEAMRDWCASRKRRNQETLPLIYSRPARVKRAEKIAVEPTEFPAALMETAARAKAWSEFLRQVLFSLTIWNLDAAIRDECAHVMDWLTACRDELNHMITKGKAA